VITGTSTAIRTTPPLRAEFTVGAATRSTSEAKRGGSITAIGTEPTGSDGERGAFA